MLRHMRERDGCIKRRTSWVRPLRHLALHSLAPRALATLDEAATSQGRAVRAAWLLALVFGVVRFLQFVGELEHAVPAAEESSSGFGSFFGRGKEL